MIKINSTVVARFWTGSSTHKPLVKKALQKMNEGLRSAGLVCCYSDEGHDFEIKFISSQKLTAMTGDCRVLGCCKTDESTIYIATELSPPRNETETISVIMHEMLHAIGIDHSEKQHSLMYKADGVRGLTVYEVEAVANLTGKQTERGES